MNEIRDHNAAVWARRVAEGNRWTRPVSSEEVARARAGRPELLLTPLRPVPDAWLGALDGARVLALASAGGQQGPLLAAAGADVVVLDACAAQLARDREVADREGLSLVTEQGDMAELGVFDAGSFDLVFHPVSNCYVPDVRRVWRECFRVLRRDGTLLAGFANPDLYLFDERVEPGQPLVVEHSIPYSDWERLDPAARASRLAAGRPLEFSHTFDEQIGGQIEAGFVLEGFYEDRNDPALCPLSAHTATFFATCAVKR